MKGFYAKGTISKKKFSGKAIEVKFGKKYGNSKFCEKTSCIALWFNPERARFEEKWF